MSRIDDVAKALRETSVFVPHKGMDETASRWFARTLDDAGHLLPDLPEMTENKDGTHSVYLLDTFAEVWWDGELGTDRLERFLNRQATPERFRVAAYALLAAANTAERNQA